ncbi:cytochrome P450 [Actinomadura kijaniata]|uniref:cytochrome P450 n=1 Tax=Actinomadura kijaniata TaxID=46161 RepID=UPI00083090A1|nr:cytochrome P450 [Actinomadura kijaniata]
MTATGPARLDDINPADPAFWMRPAREREEAFAVLQAAGRPQHFPEPDLEAFGLGAGPGYYALVRHADIAEASRTPRVFSSERGIAGLVDPPEEFAEFFGSMIVMDDPRHARLRRIVSRAFTPRVIAGLNDGIQRAAVEIVEAFRPKGGGDFVDEVAAPLPMRVICDMMGIPPEKHERVLELSNIIIGAGDPEYTPGAATAEEAFLASYEASKELAALVTDLAAERAERPTDDLTSVLVHANVEGEKLAHQEVAAFFILLVIAGNETTRNAIAHGLKLFTRHPGQRAALLEDFEGRIAGAVEEILRYASPVTYMRRTLTRDHTLGGTPMREGDKVLMFYGAANRDEAVFKDPHVFDIARDPNPHLAFGAAGPHFCLGAHLARREITVMFRELFTRLPGIRSTAPPERLLSSFVNGIKHLECAF